MEDTQFNKKEFVILGAGGLARELESWVAQTPDFNTEYNLKGYLSDDESSLDGFKNEYQIIGPIDDRNLNEAKSVLMGIAACAFKSGIYAKLKSLNIEVLAFQHISSIIGKNNIIGEGFVMCPNAIVTCNVTIGNAVFVNIGSQIGHDVKIGDYTSIMANVDIGGGAEIGRNVFIGSNVVILPGVKIPDNTRIGAGSVVMRKVKEEGTYFGNPAKKIF